MLVIVDYKMGNLQSVKRKLDKLGVESMISSDPKDILNASKLILPGVGHFGTAMKNLHDLNLIDALNEAVLVKKTPILGICLGMQLMARTSEEATALDTPSITFQALDQRVIHQTNRITDDQVTDEGGSIEGGLGWFDAEVVKFQQKDTLRFKTPHTGWNTVSIEKESPLFKDIPDHSQQNGRAERRQNCGA